LTVIKPFRAIRPSRDKAYLVATRPYYAYKKNVLEAKLETNPYTYLHVINPEFYETEKTAPNSVERYQKSREKLEEFIAEGTLIQDEKETLYIYRQSKGEYAFLGIIGGASVDQYNSGHIKKHEATITSREKHFTDYLSVVQCNAEPVLLFHAEHAKLSILLDKIALERPEYEFSTTEKIKHEIWLVQDTNTADGHHRCASSARYSAEINAQGSDLRNHFLAYFISEKRMEILDYNRLVNDLNGLTVPDFLNKISVNFTVTKVVDVRLHERSDKNILMYLDSTWYNLAVRDNSVNERDVVECLDTAILTAKLLTPVLDIHDLKTDERINFINGVKGLDGIKLAVDSGDARVGFALFPVSVAQLKAVADNDRIMPPKSTWVEPKLRSGLTMYPLTDD
jgi:uncharacterized protein (DUF1015 family)